MTEIDVEKHMDTIKELAELEVHILQLEEEIDNKKAELKGLKRQRDATVEELIKAGMGMRRLDEFEDEEDVLPSASELVKRVMDAEAGPENKHVKALLEEHGVSSLHELSSAQLLPLVERLELSREDAVTKIRELMNVFEYCGEFVGTILDQAEVEEPEDLSDEQVFELYDALLELQRTKEQELEQVSVVGDDIKPVESEHLSWLTTVPASDGNFKSHLEKAGLEDVRQALEKIYGHDGHKGRTKALLGKAKKQEWLHENVCPDCGGPMLQIGMGPQFKCVSCNTKGTPFGETFTGLERDPQYAPEAEEPKSLKDALDKVHEEEEKDGSD